MTFIQCYPVRPSYVPAPALSHPSVVVEKHSEADYALDMSDVQAISKRQEDEKSGKEGSTKKKRKEKRKDIVLGLCKR